MDFRRYSPQEQVGLTFDDIVFFAPQVGEILDRARKSRGDWSRRYEDHKRQLQSHVGWWAKLQILRTCEAYDVSIKALCDALSTRRKRGRK